MEFAGSLSHDLLPSASAELQPPVKEVRPARLKISQMDNSTNQVQITTPDIAYHADLIDTELKQLQSHKFWMLNEALDVKDLSKKLGSEVADCKAICETLNKNVSDDKARVELLNESKCKLHETCSKLEVVLMVAKDKVQKKQQQLDELDRFEAKLAEEINSKRLRDAHAELQTHQQQVQIVAERISNTKQRSEALLSQLSHLESGLKTENEARDKMLEQSSVFQEKKTTLQQQSQEENEEIKSLIRSATDTEKVVLEKQALHRELDTALVGLCAKVKLVADKKEKRGVELDSLMEVLKESEDEFSKIERTMEEIQKNASDFENTILKQQEKKNDLFSAKEALDSEKVSLDKQVAEMRKFSARKIEERKKLKTRVEELIQSCNKLNKEDKECQRHIEDINRRESSKKVSRHQLQSDMKRTACEVEKLRENINNLVRDKDVTEIRFCQLQKDCCKFSEQERAAKNELDIVMGRLESTQRALSKTKSKVRTAGVKKVRFNVDNKTNSKRK